MKEVEVVGEDGEISRLYSGVSRVWGSQGNVPNPKILISMTLRVNVEHIEVCREQF